MVGVYLAKGKMKKLIVATIMLILLAVEMGGVQWFGLLSIPILALYSGKRGKRNFKYLFYIYYPVHLVVIYLLSFVL